MMIITISMIPSTNLPQVVVEVVQRKSLKLKTTARATSNNHQQLLKVVISELVVDIIKINNNITNLPRNLLLQLQEQAITTMTLF
jgi:hypothetical protein